MRTATTKLRRAAAPAAALVLVAGGAALGTSPARGTDGTATLVDGVTVPQPTTRPVPGTGTAPVPEIERRGPAAAPLALQCTPRKLAINNLVLRGSRVSVFGVAGSRYAGARAAIFVTGRARALKTVRIGRDGLFTARVPAPKASARPKAHYTVQVGSQKVLVRGLPQSTPLKLLRRLNLDPLTSRRGTVTLSGRITPPLTRPIQKVTILERRACGKVVAVATATPRGNGRFTIRFIGPLDRHAAVYSARTIAMKTRATRVPITAPSVVQVVTLG